MRKKTAWLAAWSILAAGCGPEAGAEEHVGSTSSALVGCAKGASVCQIDASAAGDHSDASIPGSIAYHFARHANEPHPTYRLNAGNFNIGRTLTVPSGAVLEGVHRDSVTVRAIRIPNFAFISHPMIQLSDGSTLRNLVAEGDSIPRSIVDAQKTVGVTITDCILRETTLESGAHVVLADLSANLSIRRTQATHAGIAPGLERDERPAGVCTKDFSGYQATGVQCDHCFNLEVDASVIAYTRTSGIHMTGTLNAWIENNYIYQTSLNSRITREDDPATEGIDESFATYCRPGDGITAYHNNGNPLQANYSIKGNTIWLFHNHGIHVSGSGTEIVANEVDGIADRNPSNDANGKKQLFGYSAIYYVDGGDLFPGAECGKDVWIDRNMLHRGRSELTPNATKEIVRVNYDAASFGIGFNSGGPNGVPEVREDLGNCTRNVKPHALSPTLYYEFRHGQVGPDTMRNADAAAYNGATVTYDETLGRVLVLDGQNDYLRIGNATALNGPGLTGNAPAPREILITAMVKPTAPLDPNYPTQQIFSRDQCDANRCSQRAWQFRLRSRGRLEFIVFDDAGNPGSVISPDNTVPMDEWSFVAGSYDGATIKIYHARLVEGELSRPMTVRSQSFAGRLATTTNAAFIGRSENDSPGYFRGRIDDVTLFHSALGGIPEAQTTTEDNLVGNVFNYGHMFVPDDEQVHGFVQ